MIKALFLGCALMCGSRLGAGALERAEDYMAQGDWDLAEQEAGKSSSPAALRILGEARQAQGDLKGAAAAYARAGMEDRAAALKEALREAGQASPTPRPTPKARSSPTALPTATPSSTPTATVTPTHTATALPTSTPIITVATTPQPAADTKLDEERKALEDEKARLEEEKRKLAEERAELEKERASGAGKTAGPPLNRGGLSLSVGLVDSQIVKRLKDHNNNNSGNNNNNGGGGSNCCCGNCPGNSDDFSEFSGELQLRWRDFYMAAGMAELSGRLTIPTGNSSSSKDFKLGLFRGSLGYAWNVRRPKGAPGWGIFLPLGLDMTLGTFELGGLEYQAQIFGGHAGLGLRFQMARWVALEMDARMNVMFGYQEFKDGMGTPINLNSGTNMNTGTGSNLDLDTFGPEFRAGLYFPLW